MPNAGARATANRVQREAVEKKSRDSKEKDTTKESERTGTSSHLGAKYKEYMIEHFSTAYDPKNVPIVEVCVKVYSVRNINMQEGTFDAEFTVMLDWSDPSLQGAKGKDKVDFEDHFYPSFFVENATSEPEPVGGEALPRLRPEPNHVTLTQRYRGNLRTTFNVRDFPLDVQYLQILIKSRTISDGTKWTNGEKSHMIARNADELPDMTLVKIDGGPKSSKNRDNFMDQYLIQICTLRESQGLIWGLGMPLLSIMVISFGVFILDLDALGERLGLVITNMLTMVAIKWVLEARLPSVPYLTLADWYIMLCFFLMVLQALFCMLISYLYISPFGDFEKICVCACRFFLNALKGGSVSNQIDALKFKYHPAGIFFLAQLVAIYMAATMSDTSALKARRELVDVEDKAFQNEELCAPYKLETKERTDSSEIGGGINLNLKKIHATDKTVKAWQK
eukprot:jgi/Bigna1/85243/estExt_fgenesh1_pg.C_30049